MAYTLNETAEVTARCHRPRNVSSGLTSCCSTVHKFALPSYSVAVCTTNCGRKRSAAGNGNGRVSLIATSQVDAVTAG
jgi:hypothetical protein